MANRRRAAAAYRTYGSVAYAPAYDGSAVSLPRQEEELRHIPQHKPRHKEREQTLTRTRVKVRQAGAVSPFAVVGFLAVGIFAALLMFSYAQFAVLNDEVITLRDDLNTLQTEHATLSTQYERVFDMAHIQAAVGDTMVRPTNDQVVYIDLSAPDTVTVYGEQANGGLSAALTEGKNAIARLIEYFR